MLNIAVGDGMEAKPVDELPRSERLRVHSEILREELRKLSAEYMDAVLEETKNLQATNAALEKELNSWKDMWGTLQKKYDQLIMDHDKLNVSYVEVMDDNRHLKSQRHFLSIELKEARTILDTALEKNRHLYIINQERLLEEKKPNPPISVGRIAVAVTD
jgi:predicted nuclease with TOPRIM domain